MTPSIPLPKPAYIASWVVFAKCIMISEVRLLAPVVIVVHFVNDSDLD